MILRVNPVIVRALADHARREFPRECCGLLFGSRTLDALHVARTEPAANITEGDPMRSYQIEWQVLFRAVRASRAASEVLVGFYHSHPNGSAQPSAADERDAWPEYLYVMIPVTAGAVGGPGPWFKPADGGRFIPLRLPAYST
jgi:proteasome lid subunit RPN8/RPN11